jgi:hypothetical protein
MVDLSMAMLNNQRVNGLKKKNGEIHYLWIISNLLSGMYIHRISQDDTPW